MLAYTWQASLLGLKKRAGASVAATPMSIRPQKEEPAEVEAEAPPATNPQPIVPRQRPNKDPKGEEPRSEKSGNIFAGVAKAVRERAATVDPTPAEADVVTPLPSRKHSEAAKAEVAKAEAAKAEAAKAEAAKAEAAKAEAAKAEAAKAAAAKTAAVNASAEAAAKAAGEAAAKAAAFKAAAKERAMERAKAAKEQANAKVNIEAEADAEEAKPKVGLPGPFQPIFGAKARAEAEAKAQAAEADYAIEADAELAAEEQGGGRCTLTCGFGLQEDASIDERPSTAGSVEGEWSKSRGRRRRRGVDELYDVASCSSLELEAEPMPQGPGASERPLLLLPATPQPLTNSPPSNAWCWEKAAPPNNAECRTPPNTAWWHSRPPLRDFAIAPPNTAEGLSSPPEGESGSSSVDATICPTPFMKRFLRRSSGQAVASSVCMPMTRYEDLVLDPTLKVSTPGVPRGPGHGRAATAANDASKTVRVNIDLQAAAPMPSRPSAGHCSPSQTPPKLSPTGRWLKGDCASVAPPPTAAEQFESQSSSSSAPQMRRHSAEQFESHPVISSARLRRHSAEQIEPHPILARVWRHALQPCVEPASPGPRRPPGASAKASTTLPATWRAARLSAEGEASKPMSAFSAYMQGGRVSRGSRSQSPQGGRSGSCSFARPISDLKRAALPLSDLKNETGSPRGRRCSMESIHLKREGCSRRSRRYSMESMPHAPGSGSTLSALVSPRCVEAAALALASAQSSDMPPPPWAPYEPGLPPTEGDCIATWLANDTLARYTGAPRRRHGSSELPPPSREFSEHAPQRHRSLELPDLGWQQPRGWIVEYE